MSEHVLDFPIPYHGKIILSIISTTVQKHVSEQQCLASVFNQPTQIKSLTRKIIQEIKTLIYQQISHDLWLYRDEKNTLSECIDLQTQKLSSYIENEVEHALSTLYKKQHKTIYTPSPNHQLMDHYA